MPRLLGIWEVEDNPETRKTLEVFVRTEAQRARELEKLTLESSTESEVLCLLQRLGGDSPKG